MDTRPSPTRDDGGSTLSLSSEVNTGPTMKAREAPIEKFSGSVPNGSFTIGASRTSSPAGTEKQRKLDACFHKSCLHPRLSLRNQLLLSFGVVSMLSVLFVTTTAIGVSKEAGDRVKTLSRENLRQWGREKLKLSSRIIAQSASKTLEHLEGMSNIKVETTLDRFEGYTGDGSSDDESSIPFTDMVSGERIYPLKGESLLPLEWQIVPTELDENNFQEHLGNRRSWYGEVSTATPSIWMQGSCDPDVTDPLAKTYQVNCTEENNDISMGGKIQPTPTFSMIHQKVSDFAPAILKPLYEAHEVVKTIAIMFANAGAGASVLYPAENADGGSMYTSIGCDWMRAPHPYNSSKTIGTEEEIARCHPEGTNVSSREYNPLERGWCRAQALNPAQFQSFGPYRDAWTPGLWVMTFGQAMYDRKTQKFIGCTGADASVVPLATMINGFKISDTSSIALVRWDGTVVASELWDPSTTEEAPAIGSLGMGISEEFFESAKDRVNTSYFSDGNLDKYDSLFRVNHIKFAFEPIPKPPQNFDPTYTPQFFVIIGLGEEAKDELDLLDNAVDENVRNLIATSLVAGCVGIVAVLLCIYVTSLYISRPMEWMEKVGGDILESFGSRSKTIDHQTTALLRHSPRTEISFLVQEFHDFVKRFSGKGTAKVHIQKGIEINNPFSLHENFEGLYVNRETKFFRYNEEKIKQGSMSTIVESEAFVIPGQGDRVYYGPNVRTLDQSTSENTRLYPGAQNDLNRSILNSRLFWWILGFIAVPLLITMVIISVHVTVSISKELPQLVNAVEDVFLEFERNSLFPLTSARAAYASAVMSAGARDLHVMTRISEWLLFGGLKRASSVTSLETAAEECKGYDRDNMFSCPYFEDPLNGLCDCKWNQKHSNYSRPCNDYEFDSRQHQKLWWMASKLDNGNNGDVTATSYPEVANSSNLTAWWDDWNTVPGFEKGINATGYATTYEKLLSVSALSMILIPLFNYQETLNSRGGLASYVAFDSNGMLSGYGGCNNVHVSAGEFVSDEVNGAAYINSRLCPFGKHGFDPRCTSWYVDGKVKHLEGGAPLYVTAPSILSGTHTVGQTATMPLIDPSNGEYVGQTLVGVDSFPILDSLTQKETPLNGGGFTVLISTEEDFFGSDIVMAPGFSFEDIRDGSKHNAEDLVLPHDVCSNGQGAGCENRRRFEQILDSMRAGESNVTTFTRTMESGETEVIHWAYAPVQIESFKSLNSADYPQGVEKFTSNVFSIALAQTEFGLYEDYESIVEEIDQTVRLAVAILLVLTIVTFGLVSYISTRVTSSIIRPVSQLLQLVMMINNGDTVDTTLEIQGGSREVTKVRDTFERLSKVVPVANSAFFSGDLSKAYATLLDALELFTTLDNEKAIGVASNNLGNTMLAIYRTMKKTHVDCGFCGMDRAEVVAKGIQYFAKAISAGEKALAHINKVEGWSTNYLVFMQQLANRYFNRAVFLLTVKDDHPQPDEAEHQGKMDLSTAKDMDREVVDNGDQQGFKGSDEVYFELLLARIKGIVNLLELGYEDEWDIEELFQIITKALYGAVDVPDHVLFSRIFAAGQIQRLDAVLIEYYRQKADKEMAAQVAIRMLVEDEYVLADACLSALKALIDHVPNVDDLGGVDPSDIRTTLFQYRQRVTEAVAAASQPRRESGRDRSDYMIRESAKQSNIGDVSQEAF